MIARSIGNMTDSLGTDWHVTVRMLLAVTVVTLMHFSVALGEYAESWEGGTAYLVCYSGTLIEVRSAKYGVIFWPFCYPEDKTSIVRTRCNGKRICGVPSSNNLFDYTCKVLKKLLKVWYDCQDINECSAESHNCHKYATCGNTYGSFTCTCKSGYSGSGTSCVPVCFGSTSCPTGGTCVTPNYCSNCADEYYSPRCDPCPRAEVANCAHMRCDEGPTNKKCFECNLQYQSILHKCAYTPNYAQTLCDPRCSWVGHHCFPGVCSTGYPSSCACAPGFSTAGNGVCDLTIKPELDLCKFTVKSSSGERRQSQPTAAGSTSCYTEGDEWIRFVPKKLQLDLEGNFQHPPYTKLPFVRDFKYGITKSSVKMFKKPAGANVDIITYTMPGDGKCNPTGPYGDGTGLPKDQIQCDIDHDFSYSSFDDGDKLCAEFNVVAGGYTHYGDPNTNTWYKTQKKTDVPRTKTVCMRMDFTKPTHCSRETDANNCNSPTEYMTFGDRIRKTGAINLDFSGWNDFGTNPSGLKEFILNVYDITDLSTATVGMVFKPVRFGPVTLSPSNTTIRFNLTSEPQFFAIVLTAVDNAQNVREARSYVLYDASSKLRIDSTKKFHCSSATQVSGYLWQTHLRAIELSWKDYFYNDYHRQHAPLRPVISEPTYFDDTYDQVTGVLPRGGTDNVHGIVSVKYHVENLSPLRTRNTTTLEPSIWTNVSTWLNESLLLSVVSPTDGDTFKVWIQATDIMGNQLVDKRVVNIDSTAAELWDMWLIKDGHTQVYVHDSHELHKMKLVFRAHDKHSGVRRVYYRLGVTTGGDTQHGKDAVPVRHLGVNETCPSGSDPCYCPMIGPCEMSSYSLDLNPLIARNTHIGLHNRDYFFQIEVENEARLVKKFELKVLADNSPPTNGTVWDGSAGQKDVDYRSDDAVTGSWAGFIDYESGIRYYRYAVADRCWTTDELYANGTKTTDTTTGRLTTNLTRYFVSVIAINNAITPSVPSCSDGVTVDKTPPVFVSYKVPHGIFTNNRTPIYHHKDSLELSWAFNESQSQIRDYEIGFATNSSNKARPDIVGYQSTNMKAHFKRLHTGFGQASRVFVMIKATNKAGLETVTVIGPFVIDQTPPVTSNIFTSVVGGDNVTLSWSSSDFTDSEDESSLSTFKWALGTADDHQEVVKFKTIQSNTGKYLASFPLQSLINHDNEANKEYVFAIEVFNSARLSTIVKSRAFRLPTTTKPSAGVVYDIDSNTKDGTGSDIDFQLSNSTVCGKWTGFRHHRDTVTFKVALGTTPSVDDIVQFMFVNSFWHCFTNLSLEERKLYVIVKATNSIGDVTVASDGVNILGQTAQLTRLEVYDGPGCKNLTTCSSDISYQSSRLHLAGWWRHSGQLESLFTHYSISILEDNCIQKSTIVSCTDTGAIASNVNVGRVDQYVFGNLRLDNGKRYRIEVATCFQETCLPAVSSSGVMIYSEDVEPSSVSVAVPSATKVGESLTLAIKAEWDPFSIKEGTLQHKATDYKWAMTSEPNGKASITPWKSVSVSSQKTKKKKVPTATLR